MYLWDQTIYELFVRGGAVMWPLLFCSILAVALIFDRGLAHLRARLDYPAFIKTLQTRVADRDLSGAAAYCEKFRNPVAHTAAAYLRHAHLDDRARAAVVEREGSEALERIERRQRGLSVVAHIATLTGLLGTVAGLVDAFHQIEIAGGQVQPSDLASGIWAALLTTVFGLTIAIPGYVAFHLFESRADRIARRMSFVVGYLDQWLGKRTGHDESAHPGTAHKQAGERPVAGIREE